MGGVGAVLSIWMIGCSAVAAPVAPTLSRTDSLQAAIDAWAAEPGHEGVSASVILRDGTQWSGVSGTAGGNTRLREEELTWIASITKTMTGALILQLADQQRLTLEDPISRWLVPPANVDPAITLRQLLNHRSGVDNYTSHAELGAAIDAAPQRIFTAAELLSFVGPARFPPDTRTEYSNTGFVLLGQVAEQVTGEPIVELYHRRLWDPLQLADIFLPGHEAPPGPVALALSTGGIVAPLEHMALLSIGNSAWGLMSNAPTIARWGRALFEGQVISAAMQQQMRTLVPAAGNIAGESGAGLGIRGYGYLGRTQFGHSGGSPFGSSLLLYEPASGVTVAVLMNQGPGADHFVLAPRLLDLATQGLRPSS